MLLIGLMSGTSADGIDAALVEITGEGRATNVRLIHSQSLPHTDEMQRAILAACSEGGQGAASLCALHSAIGDAFAEAALAVAEQAGIPMSRVDAIASHGQTVWHQPNPVEIGGRQARGTLQLGNPAIIAARTARTVISDFRAADMAAGGQGAPLVPYFDWAVLTSDAETRTVLNIGGIANVTLLPHGGTQDDVIAFDTGPGNMLIDALARAFSQGRLRYDEDGRWAAAAEREYSGMLLEAMMDEPYLRLPPPKSTGRELFGENYPFLATMVKLRNRWIAERGLDDTGIHALDACFLMTAVAFTAHSVKLAFRDHLLPRGKIDTVIVGGGGSKNRTLMAMLGELLAPARLTCHAEFGISDEAKEAMAFALLGYESLHGRPSNLPSATGATRPVVLGSITPATA